MSAPNRSRRDFIATTAASGIALGVGQPASALGAPAQQGRGDNVAARPENALPPKAQPREMFQGTAAAAFVAQLKAAGIHTFFHTNTSGFVPLWEAIHRAGDIEVINVTHE